MNAADGTVSCYNCKTLQNEEDVVWADKNGQLHKDESLCGYAWCVQCLPCECYCDCEMAMSGEIHYCYYHKAVPKLLSALKVALKAKICPCCGRDNSNEDGCTSDDCSGVIAITEAHEPQIVRMKNEN